MKINQQLIYIAANSKGDQLFDVMREEYKNSSYIEAGYHSVGTNMPHHKDTLALAKCLLVRV